MLPASGLPSERQALADSRGDGARCWTTARSPDWVNVAIAVAVATVVGSWLAGSPFTSLARRAALTMGPLTRAEMPRHASTGSSLCCSSPRVRLRDVNRATRSDGEHGACRVANQGLGDIANEPVESATRAVRTNHD